MAVQSVIHDSRPAAQWKRLLDRIKSVFNRRPEKQIADTKELETDSSPSFTEILLTPGISQSNAKEFPPGHPYIERYYECKSMQHLPHRGRSDTHYFTKLDRKHWLWDRSAEAYMEYVTSDNLHYPRGYLPGLNCDL